jgi:hypothetical protein
MRADEKKAAISAYKKRKVVGGIYLVRCAASGETWIGACADLSTIRNRVWFTLGLGSHPNKALQQSWFANGAAAFSLEALEPVDEEDPYFRNARLDERVEHWRDRYDAQRV